MTLNINTQPTRPRNLIAKTITRPNEVTRLRGINMVEHINALAVGYAYDISLELCGELKKHKMWKTNNDFKQSARLVRTMAQQMNRLMVGAYDNRTIDNLDTAVENLKQIIELHLDKYYWTTKNFYLSRGAEHAELLAKIERVGIGCGLMVALAEEVMKEVGGELRGTITSPMSARTFVETLERLIDSVPGKVDTQDKMNADRNISRGVWSIYNSVTLDPKKVLRCFPDYKG